MNLDPLPAFSRRFLAPLALGLLGLGGLALKLLFQPAAAGLPPELAELPPMALLALSLLNPLLLLIVAAWLGAVLAHRVGLGSLAAGTAGVSARPAAWVRCAVIGVLLAVALYLLDRAWQPWLGAAGEVLRSHDAGQPLQLAFGMLYGGLAEEVMLRWGVLSLFAWILHRLFGRGASSVHPVVLATATVLSALLFAAAYLPAVMALGELTPALLARTMVLNTAAGVVYGALYCRRGLESAMLAHAATHLGFWLLARGV